MNNGHLDLTITLAELDALDFYDYFQCYQQTDETQLYYNKNNSSIWQMFDEAPEWVHDLSKKIPQVFDHHVVSVIKILPGNTIPLHKDYHYKLRTQHNVQSGLSYRYLVFLEDWKSGHYFELENKPIIGWKAGDWIRFSNEEWHIAGNMGVEPFYTAQVTVV
jgi:hypothetical protein